MVFFGILLGVLLFPIISFGGDISKFNVSGETPASFFSSGISGYYVTNDGMKTLQYKAKNKANELNEDSDIVDLENEFGMVFNEDGTVVLIRKNTNYSCPLLIDSNCVLSNPVVEKIEVKNLTGKINADIIDSNLEKHHEGLLNFTLGSKLYTLTLHLPNYDFNSFKDFDSLKCISDSSSKCVNFASHGAYYEPALMGFFAVGDGDEVAFIKNTEDNSSLNYNEKDMAIEELQGDCITKIDDETSEIAEKTGSCKTETIAKILKKNHPSGMTYYIVDYDDIKIKDEIYFTDSKGRGYKIFLNNEQEFSMSLFNKTAAEIVYNAL